MAPFPTWVRERAHGSLSTYIHGSNDHCWASPKKNTSGPSSQAFVLGGMKIVLPPHERHVKTAPSSVP